MWLLFSTFTNTCLGENLPCNHPGGYYRNPSDCSRFFQCRQWEALEQHCPGILKFDAALSVCDWPEYVDCTYNVPCIYNDDDKVENEKVRRQRESTCMFPTFLAEQVEPGLESNPTNVKVVESILTQEMFKDFFPSAHEVYSYQNFLKAFAPFPSVCKTSTTCKRELATMFAHFAQETDNLKLTENFSDESCQDASTLGNAFPCSKGQVYYGRGAMNIKGNIHYGAFSQALYRNVSKLLDDPGLVSRSWLAFASGIWIFSTPEPPQPSMLDMVTERWQPNSHDDELNIKQGFGATTLTLVRPDEDCQDKAPSTLASADRKKHYKRFARKLNLNIDLEVLDCKKMGKFTNQGAADNAIYWNPLKNCDLHHENLGYSALVDGDYERCSENQNPCEWCD